MWKGLFFGTATLIVLTHLLRDSLGLAQWTLLGTFWAGFVGLFFVGMIDFAASFFAALREAEKMEQLVPTDEQKQQVAEAVLSAAMAGQTPTPDRVERALVLPAFVSLGLLAGSALAWAGEFLWSLLPGA